MIRPGFRGTHSIKVDQKGRLLLPSDFRDVFQALATPLDNGGYSAPLVYGLADQPYVEGYTDIGMAELEAQIEAMPDSEETRGLLETIYLGCSDPTKTDRDGRFSPGGEVRKKLGLDEGEQQVVFMGFGKYFRIFRPAVHAAFMSGDTAELARKHLNGGSGNPRGLLGKTTSGG